VDQINIWLKDDASPDGRTLIGQGYFSVLPQVQEDQSSSPSPAGLLPAGG
jgi:hypothetical protein